MGVSTIFNYDLKGLVLDLAKVMRIQDWDFYVKIITGADMVSLGNTINTEGLCTRDLLHHEALIQLNHEYKDMEQEFDYATSTGWLPTLIHEMYHVVVGPLDDEIDTVFDFVENEQVKKVMPENVRLKKEALVNQLMKIFFNLVPEDSVRQLLDKYKLQKAGTSFESELAVLMKKYDLEKGGDNDGKQDTQ